MPIFTKIKNPKIPQPNPTAFSPLGGAFVSTHEKKKKKIPQPAPPLKWDQGLSPSYPLNPPLWAHWPQSRSKVNASWRKCFLSISALWPDFAVCRFFFFFFFSCVGTKGPQRRKWRVELILTFSAWTYSVVGGVSAQK